MKVGVVQIMMWNRQGMSNDSASFQNVLLKMVIGKCQLMIRSFSMLKQVKQYVFYIKCLKVASKLKLNKFTLLCIDIHTKIKISFRFSGEVTYILEFQLYLNSKYA